MLNDTLNPELRDKLVAVDAIARAFNLPPYAIPHEMLDFFNIVVVGAKKYSLNNWLAPSGKKSAEKDMHDSMGHHWAESMVGGASAKDEDSNLDPLLHLACRALMLYTRRQKGIKHPDDIKGTAHD